jgi:O-antigen ligase
MIIRNYIVYANSLILILLPFSLLTGPFLADLSISILAISFLIISLKDKLWTYYKNYFFYLFIIFYLILILSSLSSDLPIKSLETSFFYFRFAFFSLAVWYLLNNNKYLIKYFYYSLLATYSLALLDGYIQYFFGFNIAGIVSPTYRMTLLLSDNLLLGNYLARIFPLLMGLLILNSTKNRINIFLFVLLLILSDFLIYISGERTATGLIFIATVLIILFVSKYKIIRLITFLFSIIFIVIFTNYNDEIRYRMIDLTSMEMNLSSNDKNEIYEELETERIDIFSKKHEALFLTSLEMFYKNPILGIGPDLFSNLCSEKEYSFNDLSCSTHPHNNYFQLIAEVGALGLLVLIILLFYVINEFRLSLSNKLLKNANKNDDYKFCLIICISLSIFPFLPTLNLFNNWINVIYFLPVGFLLHRINLK